MAARIAPGDEVLAGFEGPVDGGDGVDTASYASADTAVSVSLAVGTAQRLPHLPELPTLLESGVAYDGLAANALFAPAGTPEPVLARLNTEVAAIMAEPAMRERIAGIGALPGPPDAASLGAMFRRDWDRARAAAQR